MSSVQHSVWTGFQLGRMKMQLSRYVIEREHVKECTVVSMLEAATEVILSLDHDRHMYVLPIGSCMHQEYQPLLSIQADTEMAETEDAGVVAGGAAAL